MPNKSSLLWRCRRGIREMDLLLQGFIKKHYDQLTPEQQSAFAQLLEQTDMDIMDWIMQRCEPPDPAFKPIIKMLRTLNDPE